MKRVFYARKLTNLTLILMHELKIISAYQRGNLAGEYLLIEVLSDTNLHNYILFDSAYSEFNPFHSDSQKFFWFPYCEVREGDYVYLFSTIGENKKSYDNALDYSEHRFFWGRNQAAWTKGAETAYLFRVNLPPQICNVERESSELDIR